MLTQQDEPCCRPRLHRDCWKPLPGIAARTYIAWCIAAISLPVLAGRLYDLTGGYEMAVMVYGQICFRMS